MKSILIVEDDRSIVELMKFNLEEEYRIQYAYDGEQGWQMLQNTDFDLLLLDLMIPKIDGISLCRKIRADGRLKMLPVIILTAKSSEVDRVLGLEIGADDYITKPFSVRELKARIKAIFRRVDGVSSSPVLKIRNISINEDEFTVFQDNEPIELTLKEFMLLKTLADNAGKVLSRSYLLDKIWGYEYVGETRTVDVHIRHLRSKLTDPDMIETVRGIGYKLVP